MKAPTDVFKKLSQLNEINREIKKFRFSTDPTSDTSTLSRPDKILRLHEEGGATDQTKNQTLSGFH